MVSQNGKGFRSSYLPTLDGWRAFAILGVVLFHDNIRGIGPVNTMIPHLFGLYGVDLFFAISGILITTRLLNEEETAGSLQMRAFYLRRAFRILPPALLYLAVLCALAPMLGLPLPAGSVSSSLFFYRNYWGYFHFSHQIWFTGHFWSLAIEEQFYLFVPSILLLLRTRRNRIAGMCALTALFFAWSVGWRRLFLHAYAYGDPASLTEIRVCGILFAVLVALLMRTEKVLEAARRLLEPPVVIVAGVLLCAAFYAAGNFEILPVVQLMSPLLIVSTVMHPSGFLGRFLELAPLRFVGRISYSLYLWQQLFFLDMRIHDPWFRWMDVWPWSYVMLAACACASYYLVERPMIRLGRKVIERHVRVAQHA